MNKLFLICISVLLLGCGGNSLDNHIGYWEPDESKSLKIAEVSREGENYFINENILRKTGLDLFDQERKPSKAILLQIDNDKLSIAGFLGSHPIALSPDNNELFIGDKKYNRITKLQLDEIQLKAETDFDNAEIAKQACKKIQEKYSHDSAELKIKYKDSFSERATKSGELLDSYQAERKSKKC
jgi:hypothetical protein